MAATPTDAALSADAVLSADATTTTRSDEDVWSEAMMSRNFDFADHTQSLLEYAVEHWTVEDVEMILNDKLARAQDISARLVEAWKRSDERDPNMLMLILDFDDSVDSTVISHVMTSKVDDELAKIACVQRMILADVDVPTNIHHLAKSKDMKHMLMSIGIE